MKIIFIWKEKFTPRDEVVRVEDDQPASAYDIGEDIVHEWFLSNYEESPAPNMCIYKKDLFKVNYLKSPTKYENDKTIVL